VSPAAVDRRAMLATMVRWTVPTVATIVLSARPLQAKASCPPCQRKQGQSCKPCQVNQIMQCQCEPCLGPPYCTAVGPAPPPPAPSLNPGSGFPSAQPTDRADLLRRLRAQQQRRAMEPRELFPDPFGVQRPPAPMSTPSLYERLQQTPQRRLP